MDLPVFVEILKTQQSLTDNSSDDCFVLDALGEVDLKYVATRPSTKNRHHKPQVSALDERYIAADYVLVLASAHYADLLADLIDAIVLELLKVDDFNGYIPSLETRSEHLSLPNQTEGAHTDRYGQFVAGGLCGPL